jgi:hypothetical protein
LTQLATRNKLKWQHEIKKRENKKTQMKRNFSLYARFVIVIKRISFLCLVPFYDLLNLWQLFWSLSV